MPNKAKTTRIVGGGKHSVNLNLSLALLRRLEAFRQQDRFESSDSKIIEAGMNEWLDQQGIPRTPDADNITVEEAFPDGCRPGFVYLMRAVPGGLYKIGKARNPEQRRQAIAVETGERIELLHAVPCPDAIVGERSAHDIFHPRRKHGEWFDLNESDVETFKMLHALDLCPGASNQH